MYNSFQLAKKYLKYYFTALNGKGHGMHSPFIFDLIIHVLNDKKEYPDYITVEQLRKQLLQDNLEIEVDDFGAGSAIDKKSKRKISSIAKNAAKPKKYGQLLYRLVHYYQPKNIFELGTSLGITSSYLAVANTGSHLTTMEGSPSILAIATKSFKNLQLENITTIEGNFDFTLMKAVEKIPVVNFAFLDGNHREEPTIRYFNLIADKINNDSIVVVDDIHWSAGMEAAWETIKNHPSVKCSVDLFFVGIIFFREEFHEKQHFTIRF